MKIRTIFYILFLSACTTAEPVRQTLPESNEKSRSISERIEEKREIFRGCFLTAHSKLSEAEQRKPRNGVVKAAWTIDVDGKMKGEPKVIVDTVLIPGVQECILSTLKTVRFSSIDGGGTIEVAYPFRFSVSP